MIKISNTKKMGSVFSWSTQAGHPSEGGSCPASFDASGNYVDACQGCYAREGNYRYPNVKNTRLHNMEDWKREDFTKEMIEYIYLICRYFRWFDSGDMYHVKLAEKIYEICKATPHCKHWIPTRQYKFPKFENVIERLNSLPNVVVRFSSDSVVGHTVRGRNTSTIAPNFHIKSLSKSFTKCNSQDQGGQCKSCRHCWDKKISVVVYPSHGQRIKTVLKTKALTP